MSNVLKVSLQTTIYSLAQRGWSQRRIAKELGVNRETVGRYLRLPKPAISITGYLRFGSVGFRRTRWADPWLSERSRCHFTAFSWKVDACHEFSVMLSEGARLRFQSSDSHYEDFSLSQNFGQYKIAAFRTY